MQYFRTLILLLLLLSPLSATDYCKNPEVQSFIERMSKKYHYKKSYLQMIFKSVRKESYCPPCPKKNTLPNEKNTQKISKAQGSWDKYAHCHIGDNHTNMGVKFMEEHQKNLKKVYEQYGVPPEYITAIIGIESYYGNNNGHYYVFDRLTHLAFGNDNRRKFYQYELQEFLRMCYREQIEPRRVKGSHSGAIGLAQFLPSNYQKFAVDFNKDGKVRMSNHADAIASIGNYFNKNGWKKNTPVAVRASYKGNRFNGLRTGTPYKYQRRNLKNITPKEPFNYKDDVMLIKLARANHDELWYGAKNFYVITRYNHSSYYAMAVHQLAQKIKKAYGKGYRKNFKL